ncbi:MAG TPA: MarR family transcriptional regulator [Jatrophihabitans sp.]|jgi:DNA-binding MarR family transcriptional regulator|uniref:MarR family winged helix-turn-helix transcriptional regulator n=1 Tax=Jatrophihabitans sp. TaxID=1932789 RepID=UPI002EF04F81
MTQASNGHPGRAVTAEPTDPIQTVEREFGTLMMHLIRYKHQVNGDRIDRMALMVLGTLAHCGPSRLSTVAERTGLDPSTVSRQVADLEKAGLLARDADPEDRRAVQLKATVEGEQVLERLSRGRRRRVERLLSDWDRDDIVTFGRLLAQLNAATEKYGAQNALELEQDLNG